ncbi:MAG: hypothetical protein JWR50_2305 [Mucilaginibacter sp.]|nr:hypothetical protein [Mucilaginibacter sp.]
MRKLFLLTFVLISQIAFAQKKQNAAPNVPLKNGEIVYEKEFNVAGKSGDQLYSNSESWFVKRYKSAEGIEVKDRPTGKVIGSGTEFLTFKGPVNRNVSCKVKMMIQINSKDGGYSVRIYNIVYGYQEDPTKEREFFKAEDMMNYIMGQKVKNAEGYNPVAFNKKQSVKALESLNGLINDVMASINQTMSGK